MSWLRCQSWHLALDPGRPLLKRKHSFALKPMGHRRRKERPSAAIRLHLRLMGVWT